MFSMANTFGSPLTLDGVTGYLSQKSDKQDQQGKSTFNERNPHATQQQEPVSSSPIKKRDVLTFAQFNDLHISCLVDTCSYC
jgi:hypothetical protein